MRLIPIIFLIAIAFTGLMVCQTQDSNQKETDILSLDEDFRLAKTNNDTLALDKILADEFFEMNQNGNRRNKAETKELFGYFKIESLEIESSQVEFANGTAVVTGSQVEKNLSGEDRMIYQRVYIQQAGQWQLFASIQFRDPKRYIEQE